MVVAGEVAFFPAETRRIPRGPGWEEVQFRIERPRTLPVEPEIPVQNLLPVRISFQELLRQERIGTVRPPVVDRALPGVEAVFQIDRVSGTGPGAFAAPVAEISFERLVALQGGVGHDEYESDERAQFRGEGSPLAADRGQSADPRGLREVHDDVRDGTGEGDRKRSPWKTLLIVVSCIIGLAVLLLAAYLLAAHFCPDFIDSLLYDSEQLDVLRYGQR